MIAPHERSTTDVSISGFSKAYRPSWWARNVSTRFGKKKETVMAVDDLSLNVPQGQIMVLLGGKHTFSWSYSHVAEFSLPGILKGNNFADALS